MGNLKRRQREILATLTHLGGVASTRQIAERLTLSVNGVSQSLGALEGRYVTSLGGHAGDIAWKLLPGRKARRES